MIRPRVKTLFQMDLFLGLSWGEMSAPAPFVPFIRIFKKFSWDPCKLIPPYDHWPNLDALATLALRKPESKYFAEELLILPPRTNLGVCWQGKKWEINIGKIVNKVHHTSTFINTKANINITAFARKVIHFKERLYFYSA